MRVQMRISEQIDSRVRRALLRIAAGQMIQAPITNFLQLGRRIESIVLPVELLQQFKSSDFPTPARISNPLAQQLRQIIRGAYERPMETGKHSEAVQTLRNLTMQLACRSSDDYAQDTCHWADGAPLNLRYSKILCSTMKSMLEWVERGLLAYHESFYRGNIDLMQSILSLGLSAATILAEEDPRESGRRKVIDVAYAKVDVYISWCGSSNSSFLFRTRGTAICFGINELTPAVIQVLIAADKLEKDLVQMAVEDSVNSDDGGKSIIQEMTPYEAEAVIVDLVKSWIKTRVDRLQEWVDRTLQQEVWSPKANRQGFAPSAVEVLRTIDETLEAFFLLPIPMHPDLLPGLMSALDRCLQDYILKAKSGCGSRSSFLPALPPLTRCRGGSKLNGVFKKKDRSNISQRRTSMQNTTASNDSYSITQLCVRVNSFHYIRKDLEVLEKRTITHLKSNGIREGSFVNGSRKNFERSLVACVEGIQQVCEATAYKLVFHELSHVLWDGLYVTGASSSRIEPFLQELEQNLEIIAETVQDNTIRTRLITNIMRASFEGFLLVLLAGGPCRSFVLEDSSIIQEDFQFLMDLFWSNGDGLPIDLIGKHSTIVKGVLPLFSSDTSSLVEKYKSLMIDGNNGSSTKSRLALPPTTDQWGPIEPNTILRVLCHRDDKMATTFLKKNYNLPKKL
ncbi:hypothetical protein OSB04_021393 [Centaurea solstitialis]|uniref:Uncharacterized protein n=1 Tax=Centaurea solstitialis TaxID=347529 RepID=A0AA38SU36_9ASTR|nr:hypothetical protein OSB04_021393 [Centaurea solstitialis]